MKTKEKLKQIKYRIESLFFYNSKDVIVIFL